MDRLKTFLAWILSVILNVIVIEANKKVFCYYSSFAQGRRGKGQFLPEDINPFLCTHVVYAFVDINDDGTELKPYNHNDLGPGGLYERTLALKHKNPSLKVLLAVGGWNMGSDPFMPVVETSHSRRVFTKNVIRYLRRYNFDGFDMDWEFPGMRGSPPEDKERFTLLMKELYESFAEESRETGRSKLLLTLATASGTYIIGHSYEVNEIGRYVDYMLLMAYNYHGQWEKETGHHSGLYPHPGDEGSKRQLNQNWSIDFWLDAGVPKDKLIIGIGTYGMSFTLVDPGVNGVFAPATGGGNKGYYTQETGVLSYYEICDFVHDQGWKTKWIESQHSPYAYGGDQWVGFDTSESVEIKAENIIRRGLGGAFVWSVEMDDFAGNCGGGKYPLLSSINEVLKPYDQAMAEMVIEKQEEPMEEIMVDLAAQTRPEVKVQHHKKVDNYDRKEHSSSEEQKVNTNTYDWKPKSDWRDDNDSHNSEESHDDTDYECDAPGIQSHLKSCKGFLMCQHADNGGYRGRFVACPEGTLFDNNMKICNHAGYVHC